MKDKVLILFTMCGLVFIQSASASVVYWEPVNPVPGSDVTIYYNVVEGTLPDNTAPVLIHLGYNGWQNTQDYQMTTIAGDPGWWKYTYSIPLDAYVVDFVFQDGHGNWDNNGGMGIDWHISLIYSWEPANPNPNDTLTITLKDCTQGGYLAWWIVSNGEEVTPTELYHPEGSISNDFGYILESPLTGPKYVDIIRRFKSGNFDFIVCK